YGKSSSKLLQSVYPNHTWEIYKFHTVPIGYWNDIDNRKEFMDWLFNQLQYKSMDDWYNVTAKDICKFGGNTLLTRHDDSPFKLLQSVYPNHTWKPYKFHHVPLGYWNDM